MEEGKVEGNAPPNQLRNRKKPAATEETPPQQGLQEVQDAESSRAAKKRRQRERRRATKSRSSVPSRATYYISGWLFTRLMGLLYVIAFTSAWVQIHGLIGSGGISPVSEYFMRLSTSVTIEANVLTHPSLFWIFQSDLILDLVCGAGVACGVALTLDMLPAVASATCWVLFLSLCVAGQHFFMYQWDLLLLECGFLTIFFHSFHWRLLPFACNPRDFHAPEAILWLFRWLLFRVHISRGIQELLNRDRIWRTLSVFDFYFETQPAPTWISYYLHQLPSLFHQGLAFWVLTVEVGVIFLIFGPQLFRRTAAVYLFLLHVFYILIGNFATYHWNVLALCVLLIDDAMFPSLIRRLTRARRMAIATNRSARARVQGTEEQPIRKLASSRPRLWHRRLAVALSVTILLISLVPLSDMAQERVDLPRPLIDVYEHVQPFRIINFYGPFHRVPHERYELRIQGSLEAQRWVDYGFLYKPGEDLSRLPPFISPHISRLEYQLWMAAQTDYQQEVW